MNKHAFIYSEVPMYASVLGWILQQSPSYESKYFKFNNYQYKDTTRHDPWDNHSDDPDDWSHAFIEDVEDQTLHDNFSWLDEFVNNFKCNSIFGLSYGAWSKSVPWNNNINQIVIKPTDKLFDFYYELYEKRPIDVAQLNDSLRMHIHDHKQDNEDYRKHIMDNVYPEAMKYAVPGNLEFWQLQSCFHHKGSTVPSLEEEQSVKNKIRSDIFQTNFVYNDNAIVIEDLFNIDIKELCKKLDIVYTVHVENEYKKLFNYVSKFIGEN